MKNANNILFALAAALLMVGCAKVEPDFGNKQAEDLDITFQVGNYAAATKATKEYESESFKTFCAFTPGKLEDGNAITYMNNVLITKQGDCWKSNDGSTYRWPKAGMLSFASYSPSVLADTNAEITYDNTTNAINVANYTVGNEDLMFSDPVKNKRENDNNTYGHGFNGVPTLFRHALAQVKFKFSFEDCPAGATITLHSATITNAAKTGDYLGAEKAWVNQRNNGQYVLAENKTEAYEGQFFNVLPQDLSDVILSINASFTFELEDLDGEKVNVTTPIVKSLSLSEAVMNNEGTSVAITKWNNNQQVIYNIKISAQSAKIEFIGRTNEWNAEDSTGDDEKIVI